jgi:hypothetical protein
MAQHNVRKMAEFHNQIVAATESSREAKNIANRAKVTQAMPGVISSDTKANNDGQDSLYGGSKNNSQMQVRVQTGSAGAGSSITKMHSSGENPPTDPSPIKGAAIIAEE